MKIESSTKTLFSRSSGYVLVLITELADGMESQQFLSKVVFVITLSGYEPSLISEPIDGMKIRPHSTKNDARAFDYVLSLVLSRRHEKASSLSVRAGR